MANSSCKLLLIDPDQADAELAGKLLEQSLPDCRLVTVSDPIVFAEHLATGEFSAVISEQTLGWASGVDVLSSFCRRYPPIPAVLFTQSVPPDMHELQQRCGSFAYVQKDSAGFLRLAEVVGNLLQASRKMQGGAEFWSQTIKRLGEPAMTLLPDGRVAEANAAAAKVCGYPRAADLSGIGLASLLDLDAMTLSGEEDLRTRLEALATGSAESLDIEATPTKDRQDGAKWRLSIWPVPGGDRLAVLFRGEDLIHSQGEADSVDKQQYEQLLYAVSHDLQEPLQLVSRYAEVLQDICNDSLDNEGVRFVSNLVSNARLMQSMLDDLLEYSRLGRLEPSISEVNLNEVVDDVLALYAHRLQELGGKVRKSVLPVVQADRGQMLRLFQNLVGNAIKFHGDKKPVIRINAIDKDDHWELVIEDNGIGIDEDQFEKVFTMFKRLHTQESIPGNGMGLALCERIVKAHGGRIWARSRNAKSRGVAIHFTLKKAD